jgi:hypothetical protein
MVKGLKQTLFLTKSRVCQTFHFYFTYFDSKDCYNNDILF